MTTVYIVSSRHFTCEGVFSTRDLAERRVHWLWSHVRITAYITEETLDSTAYSLT